MNDLEKALNEAKKAPLFDQKDAYEHFAELAMKEIGDWYNQSRCNARQVIELTDLKYILKGRIASLEEAIGKAIEIANDKESHLHYERRLEMIIELIQSALNKKEG